MTSRKSRNQVQDRSTDDQPFLGLRRNDQVAVAGLVALGLLGMLAYWIAAGGLKGRLIEIEEAPIRSQRFVVDINEADWPELAQIPGIGETLARRIVATRQAKGRFIDANELLEVRGIGPRTLDRMRPYLVPLPPNETVAGP